MINTTTPYLTEDDFVDDDAIEAAVLASDHPHMLGIIERIDHLKHLHLLAHVMGMGDGDPQHDRILEELTQGDMAGVVRLGVAETMTHTILPRLLTDLRTRHPLLRFEISVDTSEQMAQMLTEDQLDVAILLRDQAPRGAHLAALPPVSLGWFAAPAHFALPRPAGIDDLAANPIVSFPKSTLPHRRVLDLLLPGRRQAVAVHGSASLATVLHLVGQGFGIGTIPHDIVRAWPHVGIEEIPTRDDARLPDLDFAICFMPERNEDIGREVTRAALDAAAH